MEQLHVIYSRTYNFVYLRARSILRKEEDVHDLMKEVYKKAADQEVREDRLYKWLGKQTYLIGCSRYRKKKVRETDHVGLPEGCLEMSSSGMENSIEGIYEALDELPDMYLSTLLAFYYDRMKVKDIAAVMGYPEGAIRNRLDYAHKYFERSLELYGDEHRVKTKFTLTALIGTLDKWAGESRLDEEVAQNIYGSLCRELNIHTEEIHGEDDAGIAKRINEDTRDMAEFIEEEFSTHGEKKINIKITKPAVLLMAAVIALACITFFSIILVGKIKNKDDSKGKKPSSGQETPAGNPENNEGEDGSGGDNSDGAADASEYILPQSSTKALTEEDLQGMSKEQLRLARNEIYARYGMIFGPRDLKDYFSSKSWYQPRWTIDEFYSNVVMNETEQANVALIVRLEDRM